MGDNRVARQANYLIGVCLLEQGDLPAAFAQMERTAKTYPESPEFIAALFQQGEIGHRMGRHSEAVKAYQRLVSAYARMDEFHNPWITLTQMKDSSCSGGLPGLSQGGKPTKRPSCSASRSPI